MQVFENGLPAVTLPKNISNGSTVLLMGFPDCGGSYFLLMQLDKDFKPLFKLLETQPDASGKVDSLNDQNHVIRIKKIDVNQMQMHEDDMNLSLLDWGKLQSILPSAGKSNQSSGLLTDISLENSLPIAGGPPSSFSSVVDEVFELEKGLSAPSFSVQNGGSSSFNASHFGSAPMNLHATKAGSPASKWEGGMQMSQLSSAGNVPGMATHYNGSFYSSSNLKAPVQSTSLSSLASAPGRSVSAKKMSVSKSDQDLASLRSPQLVEYGSTSMDEDHLRFMSDTSKGATYGFRSSHLLSPPGLSAPRISGPGMRPNGTNLPTGPLTGSFRAAGSNSCVTTPACKLLSLWCTLWMTYTCSIPSIFTFFFSAHAPDSGVCDGPNHDIKLRKRTLSEMLNLIPSLQGAEANLGSCKRRRISESDQAQHSSSQVLMPTDITSKTGLYSYGDLISEANKGYAPSSIYVSALLHVVRHCSLGIKHARLTSQMGALDIPYVEEVGLRSTSSNIWFRLPFARGDTWQHLCLRLGRAGSIYWDVKINDQHFQDLWELQKGSNSTP